MSDTRAPLPTNREKALAAIANGWARTPTAAHPDCRCGKPYLPTCTYCHARPQQPCRKAWGDDPLPVGGRHSTRSQRIATAKDCPVHRSDR